MPPRVLRVLIILVLVAAAGGAGAWFWRQRVLKHQATLAGPALEASLAAGDFVNARAALKRLPDAEKPEWEKKIRAGEVRQGLKVRDADLLQLALGDDGAPWLEDDLRERAALILARHAIQSGDRSRYENLAAQWKDSKTEAAQWFLLKTDSLIGEGKRDEAKTLLAGKTFTGSDEAHRLARLALLEAKDPVAAWKSIEAGLSADPHNGDLLSFRAQLCEALGRPDDARQSYVAAIMAEPDNPLHRDTLANFYRRIGRLPEAVDTWREAAEQTGLGVYAFKSWFWGRMAGYQVHRSLPACKQVGWNEVIPLLGQLQTGAFTTTELSSAIKRLPGGANRREMEWLSWLETLRTGSAADIEKASVSREAAALWPGLAERLRACAAASHGKDPQVAIAGSDKVRAKGGEHEFVTLFLTWSSGQMNAEDQKAFAATLARPDSTAGALLASGWPGAAIDLAGGGAFKPAPAPPEWLVYGYAKSLQERDGIPAAHEWLEKQAPRGPASELLLGEMEVSDKAVEAGMKRIAAVAGGGSPQAGRARWTLAMAALQRNDATAARAAVAGDAELSASPRGQEIVARAALIEGKRDEATAIYTKIAADSADAMIFLSKEAFAAGRYEEAENLTRKLSDRFPEEPEFRRNLVKIQEIRAKGK